MRKRIAVLCFTDYTKEPRVLRTLGALESEFDIDIYSSIDSISNTIFNIGGLNFDYEKKFSTYVFIRRLQNVIDKLRGIVFQNDQYFNRQYWSLGRKEILNKISDAKYDVVIGHGIYTLPIIALTAGKTKKIFNAHEYYLKEFEENEAWLKYTAPYYRYICSTYLEKMDLMHCVSESIGKFYQKDYKINSITITNATDYMDLPIHPVHDSIKIIHHGAAIRSRQLEHMAELMKELGYGYELTFMLTAVDQAYLGELKDKYSSFSNIKFSPPVAVNEIAKYCNQFDIGLFILPPVNFNWLHALPNKLFEFVQARLCVAVSPNPDMKRVVKENNIGIVAEDYTYQAMASAIRSLNHEAILKYKTNSDVMSSAVNATDTKRNIVKSVHQLINA